MVAVLCNPGLRPRHWSQMSEIAGVTLQPDGSTTLQKMLDLGLAPFMEQFEAVSQ